MPTRRVVLTLFGLNLHRVLRQRGLSLNGACRAAGLKWPTVNRWTIRSCRPRRDLVDKLAAALGVPAEQLLFGESIGLRLDAEEAAWVHQALAMMPSRCEELLDLVAALRG